MFFNNDAINSAQKCAARITKTRFALQRENKLKFNFIKKISKTFSLITLHGCDEHLSE
jgi:hypothetical protein